MPSASIFVIMIFMKDLYNLNEWNDIGISQRIGEILITSGKINLLHLSMALDAQKFKKTYIGEIFLIMKAITKEDLLQALQVQKVIEERIINNNDTIEQSENN